MLFLLAGCSDKGLLDVHHSNSDPQDFRAHLLETIPEELAAQGIPGLAVALIEDGAVAWQRGFGFSDSAGVVPMDPGSTVFQVASLSKSVVAWGVLRLAERGELDLDAPIETYLTRWRFPDSPWDATEVTARRLLSHTAGTNIHGYRGFDPAGPVPTVVESLNGDTNGLGEVRLLRQPGVRWQYSGGGYTVLQLVIEEVTGQSFVDYMNDEVLDPLGLTDSSFEWLGELRPRTATPFSAFDRPIPNYLYGSKASAGLYATLEDFAHFVAAGMEGAGLPGRGVLSESSLMALYEQADQANFYGLGHQLYTLADGRVVAGHAGVNRGWRSFWLGDMEGRQGIVVLSNSQNDFDLPARTVCAWSRAVLSSRIALPFGFPGCS